MRLFLKRNKLIILSYSILFVWIIISIFNYINLHNYEIEQAKLAIIAYPHQGLTIPIIPSVPILFDFIFFSTSSLRYLMTIGILFVSIPAGFNLYNELKSGYFKNELLRMSYKTWLKEKMKYILKSSLIIPISMLFLFLLIIIISRGNFDPNNDGGLWSDYPFKGMVLKYYIFYFVNLCLLSVCYASMITMYVRYNIHYIVSIIATYFTYFGLAIITEVFIGNILYLYFGVEKAITSLSMYNLWGYGEPTISLEFEFGFVLTLVLGFLFINYMLYRNKERVMMENEK